MITAEIIGDKAVIAKLDAMPDAVRFALKRKVRALAFRLHAKVKGKLSGEVLHVRSGLLRGSLFEEMTETATSITGRVAEPGLVPYAAIHEYGGRTGAHVIEARKAAAMHWVSGGKDFYAKRVNHPGSTIPERSYMRSSLREMSGEIKQGLEDAVREGINKAMKR